MKLTQKLPKIPDRPIYRIRGKDVVMDTAVRPKAVGQGVLANFLLNSEALMVRRIKGFSARLLLMVFVAAQGQIWASEGFVPSANKNVFMIKGMTSGATVFLTSLPRTGKVLITQVHVLETLGNNLKLYWGVKFGPFFRIAERSKDSFEIAFHKEVLWQDNTLDVAILKAPQELLEKCGCDGFAIQTFTPGPVALIGHPITGRRTYPHTGKFWTGIGELRGSVEQQMSAGMAWAKDGLVVSDADALPGNSGSPILNPDGALIGVIFKLKTWYGLGYKYLNPNIEITPINAIAAKTSGASL